MDVKNGKKFYLWFVLRIIALLIICIVVSRMLYALGLLSFLDNEIFPRFKLGKLNVDISAKLLVLFSSIATLVLVILYYLEEKPSYFYFWVKKYLDYADKIIFVTGIYVIYTDDIGFIVEYFLEMTLILFLLELESIRYINYAKGKEQIRLFSENTNANYYALSKSQKEAYEKLQNVITGRNNKDEAFNIALIGEWGTGKSTLVDCFVAEMSEGYFFLKINILELNSLVDLVSYINSYISMLFYKYGVSRKYTENGIAYLRMLASTIEKVSGIKLSELLRADNREFLDIEYCKEFFAEQIQELLSSSDKRKIIIVIDDGDRNRDILGKVLKLLAQITSIPGIMCLIPLNVNVLNGDNGNSNNGFEQDIKTLSPELQKYLHVTIPLIDNNNLEEPLLKEYISQNINETMVQPLYSIIPWDGKRISLFDLNNKRKKLCGNDNGPFFVNCFIDRFLYQDYTFAEYLETIIECFFRNSKEIQMVAINPEEVGLSQEEDAVLRKWYDSAHKPTEEWLEELLKDIRKLIITSTNLIGYLNGSNPVVCQWDMLYEVANKNKNHIIDIKVFSRLLLTDEEIHEIEKKLQSQSLNELRTFFVQKRSNSALLYDFVVLLLGYYKYMLSISQNTRSFKGYLRNAILENIDFMQYSYKMFNQSEYYKIALNEIEQMRYGQLQNEWAAIEDCLELMFFDYYISVFGNSFDDKNIEGSVIFNYADKIIVVKNYEIVGVFVVEQGSPTIIDEDEYDEEEMRNALDWYNEMVDLIKYEENE